jgi:signal transduction histidine kinase
MRRLRPLVERRFELIRLGIDFRDQGAQAMEPYVPMVTEGTRVMAAMRDVLDAMQVDERALLAEREAQLDESTVAARRFSVAGVVVAVIGFAASGLLLRRAVRQRKEAKRALMRLNGSLEATVAERTRELRESEAKLERRVVERTVELQAANAELEAFAYSVSHDLRTPLRGIEGFGDALLEDYGAALGPTAKDYLDRIRAATRRMAQIIDSLLMLSRMGRAELSREPVDLAETARSVAASLSESQPERRVQVEIDAPCCAEADPRLVRVALENLLGNAWKFTAKSSAPRVSFSCGSGPHGETVFSVADNGAGFDPADAGKLFHAFQRFHDPAEYPGSGIGLATVQRIVSRHGGRIWATGGRGRGATFSFTLAPEPLP